MALNSSPSDGIDTSFSHQGLSAEQTLAKRHQCLAQADILSTDHPELSQTWLHLAAQWLMLAELDGQNRPGKDQRLAGPRSRTFGGTS